MKITLFRRQRSRWLKWEWYKGTQATYFNISFGSPNAHRWWAFDLYIYL